MERYYIEGVEPSLVPTDKKVAQDEHFPQKFEMPKEGQMFSSAPMGLDRDGVLIGYLGACGHYAAIYSYGGDSFLDAAEKKLVEPKRIGYRAYAHYSTNKRGHRVCNIYNFDDQSYLHYDLGPAVGKDPPVRCRDKPKCVVS